jgi:putative transcriptional regulator
MSASQIHNQLRKLRFNRGEMTQQELADKVGVTRQTIHHIEAGKYSPSLELAFRIAQVFDLPLTDVFQYGPPTPEQT